MSYINPENALKNAQELIEDGQIDAALEELHQALHGKKFRGNNIILEKIMLQMIDLCADNQTTQYLKEDIGHFRNVCQHTNMSLLENCLKRLKDKTDDIIKRVEEEEGEDKLRTILSEDSPQNLAFLTGDGGDINPEDLMVMANCQYEEIEERQKLMPSISFFIDVCKIILDTLRQNSKMLDFYNMTAQKCFEFCSKYNYKSEYSKVSETLHSHFNQILKQSKNPEQQSKIPFPVKLDEEDALQKVLELRYQQLKIALKMKVWSDAFKTSENIYQLINRQKHHASRMKQILSDFFQNLSQIFWESEFYLFHAYSIMNLQQIIRFNKSMTELQKAHMTAQFVLATLSVPLNNRLSNFERLSVQYNPPGMDELYNENQGMKTELFNIASMLQVKGIPSRVSLITYLKMKNLHLLPEFPQIQELFRLIEEEESPFVISKKGKELLVEIVKLNEGWSQYREFLIKTLSVRILQKCKNYFKNLKMATLKNLLGFYNSFEEIEMILYECNREGLVQTVIDYNSQSLTFDQEIEVSQNLLSFGLKLKEAFSKVQNALSEGKERERIFLKVKEKMEQEMNEVLKRKDDMQRLKEEIRKNKDEESKTLQEILQVQQQEREKQFTEQYIKEEKERQKNKLLDELELMRKIRAQEVLQELVRRGVKKIGQEKVADMQRRDDFDYDTILNFYQNILKKEKESFELEKQKKLKDVEYWARAVREEEKVAILKYAEQNGEEEMKQLQKAIQLRHEKELKMKNALATAYPVYVKFREGIMEKRRQQHQQQLEAFVTKKGEELQAKILEEAKSDLRKVENLKKVKEAEEKRKQQMIEKERKARENGETFETGGDEDGEGGWSRGTQRPQPTREDTRRGDQGRGEPKSDEVFGRGAFGKAAPTKQTEDERKPEETGGRPKFFKSNKPAEKQDDGFVSRSAMGQAKKEEEKKEEPVRKTDSAPSSGPWRSSRAQDSKPAGGDDGFRRGPGAQQQQPQTQDKKPSFTSDKKPTFTSDKKPAQQEEGWTFSGGNRKGK